MILGGALAADFAAQKKIPIPFRAQMSPRGVATSSNVQTLYYLLWFFPTSSVPLSVSPHTASIGRRLVSVTWPLAFQCRCVATHITGVVGI